MANWNDFAKFLNDPELSIRKRRVLEFMDGVLHGDKLDLIDTFVHPDYIQHTPGIGQGRDGLLNYVKNVASKRPNRADWRPVHLLEDGDIVILFKWLPGAWIADFIRFDDQDLMVEHWDVVQRWESPSPDPQAKSSEDLSRFKQLFFIDD